MQPLPRHEEVRWSWQLETGVPSASVHEHELHGRDVGYVFLFFLFYFFLPPVVEVILFESLT